MDERALLLLGILSVQSQHGYQINEFIERNLGRVTDMKKPTAYAILERLAQAGYVSVHTEQEGNRPPRKVYALTPEGERLFLELLRANLAAPERENSAGDVGLMFLDHLAPDEVAELLAQRLARLRAQIAACEQAPRHAHGVGVDLAIERQVVLLRAEYEWLAGVARRLAEQHVTEAATRAGE
jgi:DNA-binding PadR family transcriptional regulator